MNLTAILLGGCFLVALLNPFFQKFDIGTGWLMVLLFCAILPVLLVLNFRKLREGSFWDRLFFVFFIIFFVVSFIFSMTKNVGFSELMAYAGMFLCYWIFAGMRLEWRKNFYNVVIWGGILAVVIGFFHYFFQEEARMAGPFMTIFRSTDFWPNAFALFLLMVWPFFLLKFSDVKDSLKSRSWLVLGLSLVVGALFLTYSRGAFLAFGGQLILLTILFIRNFSWRNVLTFLGVGVLSVGLFLGANFLRGLNYEVVDLEERVTFGNNEALTSGQERRDFWFGAIDLAMEKPWFGWGPFSFRAAYSPIQRTMFGNSDHSHNIFLKFASENGVLAMTFFVLFLAFLLVLMMKRWRFLESGVRGEALLLVVALSGALAHSMVDYNFNFMANLLLFFLILIFLRSLLVSNDQKVMAVRGGALLAVILMIFTVYEGGLLVLQKTIIPEAKAYSFYPQNYFLFKADLAVKNGDWELARNVLDKQLKLNPLDFRAWYLRGVTCEFRDSDENDCVSFYRRALDLNYLGDVDLHFAYLRSLEKFGDDREFFQSEVEREVGFVKNYFVAVAVNLHFTAQSYNVEEAAKFVDFLILYVDEEVKEELLRGKEKMLSDAEFFVQMAEK